MTNGVNEQSHPRRLAFYSLGFFRPKLRQRMRLLGFTLIPFGLGQHDGVVVWGRKPVSRRGIKRAQRKSLPLLTIEDGFIRSLKPGWQEPPRSLSLDWQGVYFDTNHPSDLSQMLTQAAPPSVKAKAQMELQSRLGISKYNAQLRGNWQKSGYILLIDQVKGDQSITKGQSNAETFQKALQFAQSEFPNDPILIRSHPSGRGYFTPQNCPANIEFCNEPANPYDLIKGAKTVIAITSQMGFDAILAGHKPHIFGTPFYSGYGLSQDHQAPQRGKISPAQLYETTLNQYCHFFSQSGEISNALTEIFSLHDEARQSALAHQKLRLENMRAWKIPHMKRFFPNQSRDANTQILRWGARQNANEWVVEDGFLRSQGLGAKLVPPLSLIVDKKGIYFDPTKPSDLETLIHARQSMHPLETRRAQNLKQSIIEQSISKYNLPASPITLPQERPIMLVVGQVENDRSILLGATGEVKTNQALLEAARRDYPDHYILYKPHPDVQAGLRQGAIDPAKAQKLTDQIFEGESLEPLWPQINAIATITSLSGFEALLRGIKTICYGMPFYADWGLTQDHAPSTKRRSQSSLEALIYASLIDYPLYLDPKTRRLSTAETIIKRIASGQTQYPAHLRLATRIQQSAHRIAASTRKTPHKKSPK